MTIQYACILEHLDVLDDKVDISLCRNCNVQLNFYHGFDADHAKLMSRLEKMSIAVTSIHLPTVAFSDEGFMPLLRKAKELYGVGLLTLHPSKAEEGKDLSQYKEQEICALEGMADEIHDLGLLVCIENFPFENNRWVYSPNGIYTLCSETNLPIGITYDTSHTTPGVNILDEFQQVADKVKILHLSNRDSSDPQHWKVHLPYKNGELPAEELLKKLDFFGFDGIVVFEYAKKYYAEIVSDYRRFIGR
ncbi:sugar phosphate isomerase/epimerase [Candidatus Woesearchaeota archaeon]|nr:sugar phosphate isomerase/epimerase [Candidatus Woesearchaeota archaeon]